MKHTGQPLQEIEDVLERDYFMTAEMAKDLGLVDKVIDKRPEMPPLASMVVPTKNKISAGSPWWRFSPSIRADEFSVRAAGIFCQNYIGNGST